MKNIASLAHAVPPPGNIRESLIRQLSCRKEFGGPFFIYCLRESPDVGCHSGYYLKILKGRREMKVIVLLVCALSFALASRAQSGDPSGKADKRAGARPATDIVPLPSIKALNPSQAAGKKLFVQRCSVCHLPALPSYTAYGPLLDKNLVEERGEVTVRMQIMQGSARMPGFQYTLSPEEIEHIGDYLKTLDLAR